jgi:hypothetical protein
VFTLETIHHYLVGFSQVVRVLKGDQSLTGQLLTVMDSALSRHVCSSVVRLREEDTRIFYVQPNSAEDSVNAAGEASEGSGFILNSEPDRITYRNLHELNSALRGELLSQH